MLIWPLMWYISSDKPRIWFLMSLRWLLKSVPFLDEHLTNCWLSFFNSALIFLSCGSFLETSDLRKSSEYLCEDLG